MTALDDLVRQIADLDRRINRLADNTTLRLGTVTAVTGGKVALDVGDGVIAPDVDYASPYTPEVGHVVIYANNGPTAFVIGPSGPYTSADPLAVTAPTLRPIPRGLEIDWPESTDEDVAGGRGMYEVHLSTSNLFPELGRIERFAITPSIVIGQLDPALSYYARVRPIDYAGMYAPWSPTSAAASPTMIGETDIQPGSVTTPLLAADSVVAAKIAAGAVTTDELAANAVTAAKLAALTIEVAKWIQSSNYVAGVSGWWIGGNGDAEFASVDLRGTLNAADGSARLDNEGLHLYEGGHHWRLDAQSDGFGNYSLVIGDETDYTTALTLWHLSGGSGRIDLANAMQVSATQVDVVGNIVKTGIGGYIHHVGDTGALNVSGVRTNGTTGTIGVSAAVAVAVSTGATHSTWSRPYGMLYPNGSFDYHLKAAWRRTSSTTAQAHIYNNASQTFLYELYTIGA